MKLREQTLRRLVREEINFLKEEKRIIQEMDMSFFDWVVGGMGIELGRYLLQFVLTVGVVALSGLALTIKTFTQTHRELKKERNNPIAKKVQTWLANHPVFKELTTLAKEAEEMQGEFDQNKKENKIITKEFANEFARVKARRNKIISQIIKDAERDSLTEQEIKYLGKKLFGFKIRALSL